MEPRVGPTTAQAIASRVPAPNPAKLLASAFAVMTRGHRRAERQDRGPLEDVLELAGVAGPRVGLELRERIARYFGGGARVALGVLAEVMLGEPAQLGPPLAQRRQADRKHPEARGELRQE